MEYIRLDKYCNSVKDGTHDTPKPVEEGMPLVTSKAINNNCIDFSQTYNISLEDYQQINKRSLVQKWDILMTMIGSVGRLFLVQDEPRYAIKNIALFKIDDEIKSKWLYYYLSQKSVQDYFQAIANGTSQHFVPLKDLRNFKVASINCNSKRIVEILFTYDSQIENNQKRIKLLEQMAENLYKEWFVRFRFPGYETAEFEGGVPRGWKYEPIKNNNDCYLGGTPSRDKNEYWDNGTIPWINSGEINRLRVYKESELITELALKKSATKLLPIRSTLVAITGATVGQVSLNEIEVCANQSVVGVVNKQGFHCYTYYSIRQNIDTIANYASGGAQQHINKEIIEKFKVLVPPTGILEQFEKEASTYFDAIYSMIRSIDLLTTQRDLLLPRLMSGKLSI